MSRKGPRFAARRTALAGAAGATRTMALALALATLSSCSERASGPPEPENEPPLETVEVGGALDQELDTSEDVVAARRPRERVAGVLPGGFPTDLPLPAETTLVDFGDVEGRGAYVVLASALPARRLEERAFREVAAAGWRLSGSGPGRRAAKGGREVRLEVKARGAGSELRIDY